MQISKQEIMEILEKNAIDKALAESVLEGLGKGLGNALIDILGLVVEKTPNVIDDIGYNALAPRLRKYINDLEITF